MKPWDAKNNWAAVPLTSLGMSFFLSGSAWAAVNLPGTQLTVDTATGLDYTLTKNATLDVVTGGRVGFISATTSTVNIQGGRAEGVRSFISTIGLSNAVIDTAGFSGDGVSLNDSTASIQNSAITAGSGTGLRVAASLESTVGSQASVQASVITGSSNGASVGLYSSLTATDSQFVGTAGNGLLVQGGNASLTGSTVQGSAQGIVMSVLANTVLPSTLSLDNTKVQGGAGSAILVSGGADATIAVNNGSTLTAGNGVLLQTQDSSTANLAVSNSSLSGNLVNDEGSQLNVQLQGGAQLTGQIVNATSVAVSNDATWTLTGDSSVGAMAMGGGTVDFGDPHTFYTLSLASLSGSGTFVMSSDFARGITDFIDVNGQATGAYNLRISSSGADPVADTSLQVVHTGGGGATFSLVGGPVDLGTYSYGLVQRNDDWYLDASTRTVSPGAQSIIALFNTAPTVWYGELSSLRTRMGELRLNGAAPGGWIRTYANKYDVSEASGVGYQQTQRGFSLGADAPLPMGDGQWLIGVLAGYSDSDLSLLRGTSGNVHSYYAGLYTTWLDAQTGYYLDGVLKVNRFNNSSQVALSDGDRSKGNYKNTGVGGSVEFGRHIKLENSYFVEPFGQLSSVVIQGRNYDLDNGMEADGDRTRSLLGKLGATAGRNFDLGQGRFVQPYLRAAVVHEFAKNNEVKVNNNVFNNDLSGTRGELGAGVAVSLSDRLQLHADVDYSNGDKLEQPWGVNIGARYSW